jgi:hypothetical protein
VEKTLSKAMKGLRDNESDRIFFYSIIQKRDVPVHGELICLLMDQPAQRSANSMVRGNSINGARWSYSSIDLLEIHSLHCMSE